MADDIGGVWRTVGGRRIFIKDGQSLDEAMQASGKFEKKDSVKEKKDYNADRLLTWQEESAIEKALPLERTPNQEKWYKQGEKAAKEYGNDLRAALYNDMNEEWTFGHTTWYKAGFYGEPPIPVVSQRYGDIPKGFRSKNYATGDMERGVSTLGDVRGKFEVYKLWYGEDSKLNVVQGWDFGSRGSDGELLLVTPKIIPDEEVRKILQG